MSPTPQPSPETASHSGPVSTSNVLLIACALLSIVVAALCFAVRRNQTRQQQQQARQVVVAPRRRSLPPAKLSDKPLPHEVVLTPAWAEGAPKWLNIQPLAVFEPPFRQLQMQTQKPGESPRPVIKRSETQVSLSCRSEASIESPTADPVFDEEVEINFEQHLQIAVLIAMPFPPGLPARDSLLARDIADNSMTIGVADTVFPTDAL
ncbi:hypothetical protein K438DRAFT_1954408 [Mycena galopus ATCC 62051]|nr:hypothetical protein K438DRAFT_1954408 [Mycena galopus ATCC 62051]